MKNLEKNHTYFNENSSHFMEKYREKYIVISDAKITGIFDTDLEAYIHGIQNFGSGNFISKYCLPLGNQICQTFNNRIIFNEK